MIGLPGILRHQSLTKAQRSLRLAHSFVRRREVVKKIGAAGFLGDEALAQVQGLLKELAGGVALAEGLLEIAHFVVGDGEVAEKIGAVGLLGDKALGECRGLGVSVHCFGRKAEQCQAIAFSTNETQFVVMVDRQGLTDFARQLDPDSGLPVALEELYDLLRQFRSPVEFLGREEQADAFGEIG